ncbi:unnamed protein product [Rotaria socialis]|uniref:Uncharacterized protein n=1 Tax=Rotaria socialis TaxID=392032 RepID=A0A820ZVQ1_9BILA|nr:unnamed protein product [Rotaria socialis]CAF3310992.1 unnamed protein product [Rotaria socialis]CAF3451006.1 unnamed protein product [Rotaria socialis]CAF3693477.1 unnamed protein product [Rotaria socialis]CAF3754544.1 unnamed protein product [Rotaria socialis]
MGDATYQDNILEKLIDEFSIGPVVDLSHQKLSDYDMPIVVHKAIIKQQCKELWLQANQISPTGAAIIADALPKSSTLETLYLRDNRLSDKGVCFLAMALSAPNSMVKDLGLGGNNITDAGVQYLAEMLKKNTSLTTLYLRHNQISDQGVEILADALAYHNTTLKELYLSSNPMISDQSVDFLANMLMCNRSLRRLWIQSLDLSEDSKARLRKLNEEKGSFDLSL